MVLAPRKVYWMAQNIAAVMVGDRICGWGDGDPAARNIALV
jgi:hypothetical protein